MITLWKEKNPIYFGVITIIPFDNTSIHACQMFCSRSNWNYVSFSFPPRDNGGQNNEQSECLLHPQLFIPTVLVKTTIK